ncbi:Autophagy-related protein 27 [Pleurostoma richardsiae]|uniref:Autophagy-related protein 27 n=1 Tax=Pleurostoma richardsiae TaxID=41990 RepID=A0AA38R871_9PEZI|nr:Autophagy-related protein 27 [Pleurostoma richardsiae]
MAPASTSVQPSVHKKPTKGPVPPGIQTNGLSSSQSSPSPSLPTKRPPNPAAPNGANGAAARPPHRPKREVSGQLAGRASRNSTGLRSASIAGEPTVSVAVEPRPYIVTDKYILKKYAGNPPSLVVHLHPTHFRFDQQDGMFPYKSPMRLFLEHLRSRTVPHEMLEYFTQWGVPFYEGCLIVQVHDHKSVAHAKNVARPTSSLSNNVVPLSVHNYNPYLTPSPYVPYPQDNLAPAGGHGDAGEADKEKTAGDIDKENMPAPSLPGEGQARKSPPKPKITTIVLHPDPQTLQTDLAIKASTPHISLEGRQDSVNGHGAPPTPSALVPPTPTASSMPPPAKRHKREHMELDGSNIYAAEAQILMATTAPLDLEPTRNAEETILKLEAQAHPSHSQRPPEPKSRKRTVAEMAADEALAAEQERYMLTMDERLSAAGGTQGGGNGGDGDGQTGAAAWEPRFERFKKIEDIKRDLAERKEQEKIKQAENERKLALQKQQQQQQQAEQAALLAQRQQEEKAQRDRQEQQARQQQQEAQRRMAAARAQQAQAQAQQAQAAQAQAQAQQNQMATSMGQPHHAHPAQASPMPNGMPGPAPNGLPAQAQARFHQQVSQPPVSSPIVRQNTPQTMSSPMVGAVGMQHTGSSMGASPPRPSSVVQNHPPMAVPMAVSMSARGSQQSHPSGTPRMPNSTPNMGHATPINRPQMIHTPRMTQASPPPGMMVNNPQMSQGMMMNSPGMQQMPSNLMAAQLAAAQQQRIQQQQQMAAAAAMQQQNGMMNGGVPNPQIAQQIMQQRLLQQRMMQQQNMAGPQSQQQLAQRYAQQLNNMQQMQQMQAANNLQNQMQRQMAQGQGGGFINVQGMQVPAQQAAQMIAMQQQAQQQQHQQQIGQAQINQQIQIQSKRLFHQQLPNIAQKYGGAAENIPPEVMESFKRECMIQAKNTVTQVLAQRRAQQVMMQQQHQQQQQQQQAMQGMGGMMPQGM